MTRPATLAVGFDVALTIGPESYEISEDARGRAWAFAMDEETRPQVADAVRQALGDLATKTDRVDVEPGYLRVRVGSPNYNYANPREYLSALKSVASIYNEEYAAYPDTELVPGHDYYVGTFSPDDALDRTEYLARQDAPDATPESDGPVWTYTRDDAGETALEDSERSALRVFLPFDCSTMYDPETPHGFGKVLAFEWDRDEIHAQLTDTVESLVPWPGSPSKDIPRVAVYPTHVEVDVYTGVANPAGVANGCLRAFLRYNTCRPVDKDRSPTGRSFKHPKVAFSSSPFVAALDHGRTVDDWIADHSLDAVTGDPVEPESDESEDDNDAGLGGRLSPFSGGS